MKDKPKKRILSTTHFFLPSFKCFLSCYGNVTPQKAFLSTPRRKREEEEEEESV